jgi:hypothetical protein
LPPSRADRRRRLVAGQLVAGLVPPERPDLTEEGGEGVIDGPAELLDLGLEGRVDEAVLVDEATAAR